MGLFGGDKTENTYVTQTDEFTAAKDNRILVEGSGSDIVGPGSAIASPSGGAITAEPGATVSQTINTQGLNSESVKSLLDSVLEQGAASRDSIVGLGSSLADSLKDLGLKQADTIEGVKAPEQSLVTKIVPLALVAGLFIFIKAAKG